jgi:hypothetical protein
MTNRPSQENPEDESETFEYVFGILRNQLLNASVNFYIWEQLFPTEKVIDIINRYIGFFQPTREAHLDGLIIKVTEILSGRANAASFYHILDMIARNPKLAPGIDVDQMRGRLANHRKVVEAIKHYRNKRVAHWDISEANRQAPEYAGIKRLGKPVLFGETREMLADLQAIYNKISASHCQTIHAFRYGQQADTPTLIETLREKLAEDNKRVEYWQHRIRRENKGLNNHD